MGTNIHGQTNPIDPANKKLTYFAVISILIILIGVFLSFSGVFSKTTSASVLEIPKTEYDFGDIDIFGGKVTTEYPLKNLSNEPITITSAKTTCMCTEGEIGGKTFGFHTPLVGNIVIKAGETKILKATFDPMAHGPDATGPITRSLLLKTNSNAMKDIKLNFQGNVVKK